MSSKYINYSEKVTELLKVEPQKKYQGKIFLETNNEYNIGEFFIAISLHSIIYILLLYNQSCLSLFQ